MRFTDNFIVATACEQGYLTKEQEKEVLSAIQVAFIQGLGISGINPKFKYTEKGERGLEIKVPAGFIIAARCVVVAVLEAKKFNPCSRFEGFTIDED